MDTGTGLSSESPVLFFCSPRSLWFSFENTAAFFQKNSCRFRCKDFRENLSEFQKSS
jgi:hypothetical protein